MSKKFSISYVPSKTVNWIKLIYGDGTGSELPSISPMSSFHCRTRVDTSNSNSTVDKERANDADDDREVGGLFHVTQKKKINVNDQEDYTFMDRREQGTSEKSRDWDLDEVRRGACCLA